MAGGLTVSWAPVLGFCRVRAKERRSPDFRSELLVRPGSCQIWGQVQATVYVNQDKYGAMAPSPACPDPAHTRLARGAGAPGRGVERATEHEASLRPSALAVPAPRAGLSLTSELPLQGPHCQASLGSAWPRGGGRLSPLGVSLQGQLSPFCSELIMHERLVQGPPFRRAWNSS